MLTHGMMSLDRKDKLMEEGHNCNFEILNEDKTNNA